MIKVAFFIIIIFCMVNITFSKDKFVNRLIKEKSPYLLQHADNPVDWYPWGEEAFEKSKKEDKPIFLSIGYSTCHWCHVMEEESFTNPEIAKILNEHFISIKVDREERPDIDNIYMKAVIALTGSGGWPLTVFLTPDKKPFFGGTYFPPEDKYGRVGLKRVLRAIAEAWRNNREKILQSSKALTEILQREMTSSSKSALSLSQETLKEAYNQYFNNFDINYGGFGEAPKFPMGHSISFLLRYWKRTSDNKALEMAERTLTQMAKGGIYDHLGGGFHRYATDAQWKVPHFEKMLYDQAILAKAYLEAFQATEKEEYARIAKETFEYVLREMTSPEGGFYSAEDADSPNPDNPNEKQEGAYYLWNYEEIINILGKEYGQIFDYHYGIFPDGNISTGFQKEFEKKNILYISHSLEDTAKHFRKSVEETKRIIVNSKKKLLKVRLQRKKPFLDDKILVNWNGLMISSLAIGCKIFGEDRYCKAGEKAAVFILDNLFHRSGRLLHRYRDGEAAIDGNIEDYAFLALGLFDLYESTFNTRYLKEAKNLTQKMIELFWDKKEGGFFFTSYDSEKLIAPQKEVYDGAIPSANSIAALNLIRIGKLTMNKEFENKAETLLKAFANQILQNPMGYSQLLIALDFLLGPSKEIIISGDKNASETKQMISFIYKKFIPNKVIALRPNSEEVKEIIPLIPFIKNQIPIEGKTTAYVCENYNCKFPTNRIRDLEKLLGC